MAPTRAAWQNLPVAEPISGMPPSYTGMPLDASGQRQESMKASSFISEEVTPQIDACGRFLLWVATVLSCCTITDWSQATKAQMWRSRVSLMLIYMIVLISTGITMFAFYGGYEKLTVLDDQGQRTMLRFGEGNLVNDLALDTSQSCGKDNEGIVTFTNHSDLGLFGGFGPEGCISVHVHVSGASVLFEDITAGTVISLHTNVTKPAEYLCQDGTYLLRVLGGDSGEIPKHTVLLYSSDVGDPVLVEKPEAKWFSNTIIKIDGGRARVLQSTPCAAISVTANPSATWELAVVDTSGRTAPILSAQGAGAPPAVVCAPIGGSHLIFRLFDSKGNNLMAEQGTSCKVEVTGPDGATAAFTCGSGPPQDTAVLYLDSTQTPRFLDPSGQAASCSTFTLTIADGVEWWLISPAGSIIRGTSSMSEILLCETGLYEFSISGVTTQVGGAAAASLKLSNSMLSAPLVKAVRGSGLEATAVFRVDGADARFLKSSDECLRANVVFDVPSKPASWTLTQPERFASLLVSTVKPWQLPSLSGDTSGPLDRYLCQRGPYTLKVNTASGSNFKLAFNGDASSLPSCSLNYCQYHGCTKSGGGLFGALQSLQDSADAAWEGLGNEEGSLAIDVTEVMDPTTGQPVNCGYSSDLEGKDPPPGGKPSIDVVYFTKSEDSVIGELFLGSPNQWDVSYETAPKSYEVAMFCRPVQCPNVPPPAMSPPPPPPSTAPSSSGNLFDSSEGGIGSLLLDGGSSRQCYPLHCNSPAGEALEYQCWQAHTESTGLMAVMTMVALAVCPLGWFVIKMLGIKAEAYLNDEKEAEEHGEGCCQFPCFFCCTCCGCSCGIGTLKVVKFCLTFGANAVLAINLSFAYDANTDQYFADIFAATTWLAYFTIVFMAVNMCWGLCNFRDMFKSREELQEDDAKFSRDGWSPNMCCQLIVGIFALGGVLVGVFVWGANAVQELGAYVYTLEELMAVKITGEQISNALKKIAMGIALIHPDLFKLPDLTPIVLQINISIAICVGPLLFLLDLVAQLPFKLIAGFMGLGPRIAQVVPFSGSEAVTRADVAQRLDAVQSKVGGKLAAKDDAAAKKQRGQGLDGRLHDLADGLQSKAEDVQGRFEALQGGLDNLGTLQSGGATALLQDTRVVDIADDPWAFAETEAESRIQTQVDQQTFGRLDKMDTEDEERQAVAAQKRSAARRRQQ